MAKGDIHTIRDINPETGEITTTRIIDDGKEKPRCASCGNEIWEEPEECNDMHFCPGDCWNDFCREQGLPTDE